MPAARGSREVAAATERVVGVDRSHIDREAREALTSAGYKPSEARVAVEAARPHVGADATLEQLIRAALRCAVHSR